MPSTLWQRTAGFSPGRGLIGQSLQIKNGLALDMMAFSPCFPMAPCSFPITVSDTTVADCKLPEVSAVSMTLSTRTESALGRLTETEYLISNK